MALSSREQIARNQPCVKSVYVTVQGWFFIYVMNGIWKTRGRESAKGNLESESRREFWLNDSLEILRNSVPGPMPIIAAYGGFFLVARVSDRSEKINVRRYGRGYDYQTYAIISPWISEGRTFARIRRPGIGLILLNNSSGIRRFFDFLRPSYG